MKRLTTDEFINKAIIVHKNRYTYDRAIYQTAKIPIKITCKIHGDFEQTPDQHTQGYGCLKCGGSELSNTEDFIKKAVLKHGELYDYSLVKYQGAHKKIPIKCLKHHFVFKQSPTHHLSGKGCPICVKKYRPSTEYFIDRLKVIHGEKYDYSKVEYGKNNQSKIKLYCKKHDIEFIKVAADVLRGQGCPICSCSGFKKDAKASLYYILLSNGYCKIGVTNNTIEARYTNTDLAKFLDYKLWEYEKGLDAYIIEQFILDLYKEYKYVGDSILASGNTEIFTYDVLGLFND